MIIFIYNIIVIFFSLVLITSKYIVAAKVLYTLLIISSAIVTTLLSSALKVYPNLSQENLDGVKIMYYNDYSVKMSNYIGSGLIHAGIAFFLLQSIPITIGILILALYRMDLTMKTNKKIKAYLND